MRKDCTPPQSVSITIKEPPAGRPVEVVEAGSSVRPVAGGHGQSLVDSVGDYVASPAPKRKARTSVPEYKFGNDHLGELVCEASDLLRTSETWEAFVEKFRGRSHISDAVEFLPHPAGPALAKLKNEGASVKLRSPPPSEAELLKRIERGPHKSANEHSDFIRTEMAEFHEKGFWVILPYEMVKEYVDNLGLSPLGAVPQRDRRPRLINDLSFYLVNQDTEVEEDFQKSLQFGRALYRVLHIVRHADPKFGPVKLSKIDIKDGFYREQLKAGDAPQLACLMPKAEGEPQLVAVPLALPMGWVESPPKFCALTETGADLANSRKYVRYAPPHRLEQEALHAVEKDVVQVETVEKNEEKDQPVDYRPNEASPYTLKEKAKHTDIYVDDFLQVIQGGVDEERLAMRVLLHTIDEIFQPSAPGRDEPVSVKKLLKGDGKFECRKIILGWLVDTAQRTIQLPAHRAERLAAIFEELQDKKRVATQTWHKMLGELRSMSLAIPGARGLFSSLQLAFKQREAKHRIRIDKNMRQQLSDFAELAHNLHERPTRVEEVIPDIPSGIGACDAALPGMGGVWFVPGARPIVWRKAFPTVVQDKLVSDDNPTGTITNSDLELAGMVVHRDVLAQTTVTENRTFAELGDNIPALVWQKKGSTTTEKAPMHLLRLSALKQRHDRNLFTSDHVAGKANTMADDASRLWELSDDEFLTHFNTAYPQDRSWKLYHPRKEMNTATIAALLGKSVDLQGVLNEPERRTTPGSYGWTSAQSETFHPYWKQSKIRSSNSKYLPIDTETGELPPARNPYELEQWRTPYVESRRRYPAWGPTPTTGCNQMEATCTDWTSSSKDTRKKMTPRSESSPFPLPLSEEPRKQPKGSRKMQSEICASSAFSSSTDQESMSKHPTQNRTRHLSDCVTSPSSCNKAGDGADTKYHWRPWEPLGPRRFYTPTKRMECKGKGSTKEAPHTKYFAQPKQLPEESGTSESMEPQKPHRCTPILTKPGTKDKCIASTSPQPYGEQQRTRSVSWGSPLKTFLPEVCGQEEQQPCYARGLIPTLSGSSADGNPTKCSSTFMQKPTASCATMHNKCSRVAPSPIVQEPMWKTQIRSLHNPPKVLPHLPAQMEKPPKCPEHSLAGPSSEIETFRSVVCGLDPSKLQSAHNPESTSFCSSEMAPGGDSSPSVWSDNSLTEVGAGADRWFASCTRKECRAPDESQQDWETRGENVTATVLGSKRGTTVDVKRDETDESLGMRPTEKGEVESCKGNGQPTKKVAALCRPFSVTSKSNPPATTHSGALPCWPVQRDRDVPLGRVRAGPK